MFFVGQHYLRSLHADVFGLGNHGTDDFAGRVFLVREAVELMQRTQIRARHSLYREDRSLVGLERAEQERLRVQVYIVFDQIRECRKATVVMNESDDLPVGQRDGDAAIDRIGLPEDRPRKDGRAFANAPRATENVILEAQP
jgi:hypothetical protein